MIFVWAHAKVLRRRNTRGPSAQPDILNLASHPKLKAKEFIECSFYAGRWKVTFSTLASFDLGNGSRTATQ